MTLFDQIVILIITLLIGIGGWRMTISDMAVRSSATDIPLGYIDAIVPVVAIIMVFIQIEKIIGFFIGNKQSKKEV